MENLITLEDLNGTLATLPRDQTLELRAQFIPKACKLHFEKSPLKVIRANGQYLYDDNGSEYLDCVNCVAHVGHCNPTVVEAAKTAMLQMGNIPLGMSDIATEYVAKMKATFPPEIDTFLFVSSGSEANDLAIQMARRYTGGYDVAVVDRSFHGGLSLTNSVSPRQFTNEEKCPDWVHVLQCPDLYGGKYRCDEHIKMDGSAGVVTKYCQDAKQVMENAVVNNGRKLACFICEPVITLAGVIMPPSKWLHSVYNDIRSFGGLAIADETQSGLGRCGASMWSFQMFENLTPDIITIGKPLGNGHPMACVATRSCIAAKLVRSSNEYICDMVSAAIGLAVLTTVRSLSLQMNAKSVGNFLREGIRALAVKHPNIGQVRGTGLMIGVEIVYSQESRKPARYIAERICYKLLEHYIIVSTCGTQKNVLMFTPPMCFTCENAHRVVVALGKVFQEIEEDLKDISRNRSSIIGRRILSLDELVDFFSTPGGNEVQTSRSSSYNQGEVVPTSTQNLSLSASNATFLDKMEEDDDGGYVTLSSFSSMD